MTSTSDRRELGLQDTEKIPIVEEAPASPASQKGGRDRYFDLLRAVALFRVVLYHLMGWAWLPLVFPSMGVMFALAGNLMSRSLGKRPAPEVIRGRLRRLLPPLWLLGVIAVTGMALAGWGPGEEGHPTWWWLHLGYWVLPLSDPPYAEASHGIQGLVADDWPTALGVPLWYIRAYLWFVLLSPLLRRALRAAPWPTILAPLALSAALEFTSATTTSWRLDATLTDFATFGSCWLLGMAHQQGVLQKLPRYTVPSLAPAVAAVALWYALAHDLHQDHDLDDMPFAQSLWSFAAVLLLLHLSPSWRTWPPALRRWDGLITLLNSRAVTIYLWHNLCIVIAEPLWDHAWNIPYLESHAVWLLNSPWPVLPLTWLLTALCVLAFGWMEDLAAGRRPTLWPNGRTRGLRGRGR
ncbi:acyltransferase family protein [Streptomyces niveiscabiei]|uniref:acyltransferase family protein n=1 Tax=Streptomyces niveiscabiei TaxID=164115 RepID=UPI0029AEBF66|nr:acyltransferase family protein [Streptomyces niveiscabiei]MDX3385741.1 acyltransferase family protein [Streptomyces niveiscabiei]